MSAIDLIPWEKSPKTNDLSPVEITWRGGLFRIPRLGYLTADELQSIYEVDPRNQTYRLTIDATNKVYDAIQASNPEDMPTRHQIFIVLSNLCIESLGVVDIDFSANPLRKQVENHSSIVEPFIKSWMDVHKATQLRGTTIMMQRVVGSWTDSHSESLPRSIRSDIYSIYQDEENSGNNTDQEQQKKAIEEDIKKLRSATRSIATDLTSPKSTGKSALRGKEDQNSAEKHLEDCQVGILSRQRKKRTNSSASGFTAKS